MEKKASVVTGKFVGVKRATFSDNVGIGVDRMLDAENVDDLRMHRNLHIAPGQRLEIFGEMETAILRIADTQTRQSLLNEARYLEQSIGRPDFAERYQKFVSLAADHWTLLAPFIPLLAKFLGA